MVYYFTTTGGIGIYMGKDKHENEDLIAYGWPEDVWFHVDDLSSAHVYLRLPRGPLRATFRQTGNLDHLPDALKECCALVKANSIEGSKKHEVDVVYTPWENLEKRSTMAVGQIGFKDDKKVVKVRCVTRERDIVKRLEKTKTEDYPDLYAQRQKRDEDVRAKQKERRREASKQQRILDQQRREEADARSYDRLFQNMRDDNAPPIQKATADDSAALEAEDDFM
ncbi:hypothetical protein CTAYLR_006209 [Chrysophaeum taylorii]|uniref:NFACT RNA-binding domain-containing protein n=1 Tax=Chrysophaeum taylorii TaxID=2483200 RepID=A0AAD7U8P5_9STRA|nr:hypothetical protein CTAYLR_006209 [Chrysophaeum taylorii]